jgi:hypothetical protein
MKITIAELKNELLAARALDEHLWKNLYVEAAMGSMWSIDDRGCTYLPSDLRHLENLGAIMRLSAGWSND